MRMHDGKGGPGIGMLRRTLFLMAVCGIVSFAVLLVRLYHLQITEHDMYESLAVGQQLREAAGRKGNGSGSAGRSEPVQRRQHRQPLQSSRRTFPGHRGGRAALPPTLQRVPGGEGLKDRTKDSGRRHGIPRVSGRIFMKRAAGQAPGM